jgi:hypothetical protein
MALGELRKIARINAITTAAENARSYGEEGSEPDDHNMTEEEFTLFLEECQKLAKQLDNKARKLQFGK